MDDPSAVKNDFLVQAATDSSNDPIVDAAAASAGSVLAATSNVKIDNINSTPVVAQAKQSANELSEITRKIQTTISQSLDNMTKVIEAFHNPFVDKSTKNSAQLAKEEKEAVSEVVKSLEQIKQQLPISPDLIKEVSKNDLKSKESMEKLMEVVEVLKELNKSEKDPRAKVIVQEALTELKTTLETISLTKSKDGQLAKIFNSTAPVEEKLAKLMSLNNPVAVTRYVKENPVVMKEPLFGENNRKTLMSYVLQENRVKPKDVEEFNSLAMSAIKDMRSAVSSEKMVEELASTISNMPPEKASESLVKGIVLLEQLVKGETVKAADVKKQVPSLVQSMTQDPVPRNEQEVLNIMAGILSDPSIVENINKSETIMDQTTVVKMIAEEMPEIKKQIEKLKIKDFQIKKQEDTSEQVVSSAVAAASVTPVQRSNFQIENINSTPEVAQAKQTANELTEIERKTQTPAWQSVDDIQKVIESFYSPFVDNSKRSPEQIVKDEKEAVTKVVKSLEQIKQQLPIAPELIKQVSKNDLKSKESIEKLVEVVDVLKELSKKETDPKLKIKIQEALTELKTTLETISLTKSKDGNLAKIFNSSAPVEEKTAQLLSLKNPIAVTRYIKENPVVMKEPLLGENNRKSLMSYIMQESKVKQKDVAEFNTLSMEAIKEMRSAISSEKIVEELASTFTNIPKDNADQTLVKGIVLLEEMAKREIVDQSDVKKQIPSLVQAVKENPVPRNDKEVLDIMIGALSDPTSISHMDKAKESLAQTKVVKLIAEEMPLIKKQLEHLKVQNLQIEKQKDSSEQVVASAVAAASVTPAQRSNFQIENINSTPEVAQAKQSANELSEIEAKSQVPSWQSVDDIQKAIESFFSPFVDNSKKNSEQIIKDEKEAVTKIVKALEQIKQQLPISPELIKQVSKNDLKSKESIEKLLEVVTVLQGLSKTEKDPKLKGQIQEALTGLKTTLETISLTKSKDGSLAKIFSSDVFAKDKLEQLIKLNNPIAFVRYVKENPVVIKNTMNGDENMQAIIGYLLQEDRIKTKDKAEFQILSSNVMEDIMKSVEKIQVVEELLGAVAIVPAEKANKSLVKAMVLMETLAKKYNIKEDIFKDKMADIFELVKYSPIPRSENEINKIIKEVITSPDISLDIKNKDENVLEKTKVIKLIAERFNIENIPAVDVLGSINPLQSPFPNVENVVSDNFIPERGQGGLNPEDIQGKNVDGVVSLIDNIYEALDNEWKDIFNFVLKNLEQISTMKVIKLSEEFRSVYSQFKSKNSLSLNVLQEVVDQLSKDVEVSKLTIEQRELLSGKVTSLHDLISNIEQTKGKEQKIVDILSNQKLRTEEKINDLISLKFPEKVLSFILNNSQILESNREVILGYIAQEKGIQDIEQFVDLSKQVIVSMKLSDKEKSSFIRTMLDSIRTMSSVDADTVIEKSLSLLDELISSGQFNQNVSKEIIPQMLSSVKKESEQKQIKIVANIISRLNKPGQEGPISSVLLQNFSDIRSRLTNSSSVKLPVPQAPSLRAPGTDLLISKLPVEVLAKDLSHVAVKSVLEQTENSPRLLDNEKISSYLLEYLTSFLKLSSWGQDTFQPFSVNVHSLLSLSNSKGEAMFNELINNFINGNNNPQETFVAVLKILALYEQTMAQNTNDVRQLLSKLREGYDRAIEYLIMSLPTLGEAVGQAVGYLSKQTRDKLRERVENPLNSGTSILKRGNELILKGLNEAEGIRK
ncbi:MAG: hypothetical protein WCH76_04260 [Candidatus Riflemargulisbacteria bacterium]